MSRGRDVWLAAALLAGLFLAGMAAGVGVDRLLLLPANPRFGGGPPGPPHEMLQRELGLDDAQATKLRAIFDDARREAESIHQSSRPELDAIFERANARVRGLLTDEQRARFEELQKNRPPMPPGRRPPGPRPPGFPRGPPPPPGR